MFIVTPNIHLNQRYRSMPEHHDTLESINQHSSLKEKLVKAHESLKEVLPFIARISVTIYDTQTRTLRTFLDSNGEDESPLTNYQTALDNAPSLKAILDKGLPRVINNMLTFEDGKHEHTKRIGRSGYAASYTLPMFDEGDFIGFIFFNSYETDVFNEKVLHELDLYGHIISLVVIKELSVINVLNAAVKTTGHITHLRDPETGSHLDRMSRYSRLIASMLANEYELDDDYIEHVFMYSPLHDIGKVVIPDSILLKPGPLTPEEMRTMKTHAVKGREMIDTLVNNFELHDIGSIDILRNIAEFHHEAVNGSGYPHGKSSNDIPLEARIVAVADVFDALTSRRPYKDAWSNEDAINKLKELSGETLDQDCVTALINSMDKVEEIQKQFREKQF